MYSNYVNCKVSASKIALWFIHNCILHAFVTYMDKHTINIHNTSVYFSKWASLQEMEEYNSINTENVFPRDVFRKLFKKNELTHWPGIRFGWLA